MAAIACSSFPCAAVCSGVSSHPPVNAATCDLVRVRVKVRARARARASVQVRVRVRGTIELG